LLGDASYAVVMHNGFDGSTEEMHFFGAQAGIERGYHILTFDGAGQPSAIRQHNLPFRPDWEHVVAPVPDYLATRRRKSTRGAARCSGSAWAGCWLPGRRRFRQQPVGDHATHSH